MAWAVCESDWSDAAAVCRDAWSWAVSAPVDKSVPSAVADDWTLPMSVMTASSWVRPPLSRHEMTWLVQSGAAEAADAEAEAEAAADAVDVAATFPVDGELCAVATLMATMIPIKVPRPMSALRPLRFPGCRGARCPRGCGPGA